MHQSWLNICIFLLSVTIYSTTNAYKILGVFPHSGKSHFDVFVPLMRELARRGHDVTVISHFPEKNPLPNYKDISLVGTSPILVEVVDASTVKLPMYKKFFFDTFWLSYMGLNNCEALGSPQMQNFIKSNQSFDLIIQEHFNTDCYLVLNHIFKAPSIAISSCTQMPWTYDRFGTPLNPSYVPINLLNFSDKMSFFQRVINTLSQITVNYILSDILMTRPGMKIVRKHLGDDVPDLTELAKNTSLMLLNSHYSINRARPLPQGIIEVSGIHLEKPKKLPEDLDQFISNSKHGVIYFSMGSMIKGTTFPIEKRQMFLEAFAELKQNVLWKYENQSMPGQPSNVKVSKWMPQWDILNHPNVIAYIGHGGLLGSIEGVATAKPMILMPMYGDQYTNAKGLERSGAVTLLDFDTITKEQIRDALKFVLDPKTQEKAKLLSKAFHDRPMKPMEAAVWWVEYVARNKGSEFLRSSVIDMPVYQSSLLDVIAFLIVVLIVILYICYRLIKLIIKKLFIKKDKKLKNE